MRIPGQYASFDCMEKQGFGQNRQLNICESRALHLNLVGAVPFSIHLIAFLLLWTDESFEHRALHTSSQFHTWQPHAASNHQAFSWVWLAIGQNPTKACTVYRVAFQILALSLKCNWQGVIYTPRTTMATFSLKSCLCIKRTRFGFLFFTQESSLVAIQGTSVQGLTRPAPATPTRFTAQTLPRWEVRTFLQWK